MSTYSHRDHRVFRATYRLVAVVAAVTTVLVTVGLFAPWAFVGELAIVALAALGGVALLESGAIVDGYVDDLRRVGRGDTAPPFLRVEVESRIELERPVFVGARPSPHGRRVRRSRPPGPIGRLQSGEST